jgi:hypothetical protein
MAGVQLEFAGITSIEGIEGGMAYIDALTGDFPPLAEMQESLGAYADGINAIRGDMELTDEQRQDQAADLFERHEARYRELSEALAAQVEERLASTGRALFGQPGAGSLAADDAAREAQRAGFRDALLSLSGADEARLSEAVEVAGLTGDAVLLRAARVAAERQGLSGLVERSVFEGGSDYEQSAYAERLALPSGENLGIVSGAFAPDRPSYSEITPTVRIRVGANGRPDPHSDRPWVPFPGTVGRPSAPSACRGDA